MEKLRNKTYLCLYLIIFFVFGCASQKTAIGVAGSAANRVKELEAEIEKSDYIGVYSVIDRVDGDTYQTIRGLDLRVDSVKLRLEKTVKGKPPYTVSVYAGEPSKYISSYYFWLTKYHEEMANGDKSIFGLNNRNVTLSDSSEIILPDFYPGYLYLIFSDKNSKLNFEPILTELYDPLYAKINDIVNGE